MGWEIYVDPEQMTDCVGNIETAVSSASDQRGLLDDCNDKLQSGSNMSQDGKQDDRFKAFCDTMKEEIQIIADMLGAFKECLTSAADCFSTVDADIATAFTPSDAPPAHYDEPQAV